MRSQRNHGFCSGVKLISFEMFQSVEMFVWKSMKPSRPNASRLRTNALGLPGPWALPTHQQERPRRCLQWCEFGQLAENNFRVPEKLTWEGGKESQPRSLKRSAAEGSTLRFSKEVPSGMFPSLVFYDWTKTIEREEQRWQNWSYKETIYKSWRGSKANKDQKTGAYWNMSKQWKIGRRKGAKHGTTIENYFLRVIPTKWHSIWHTFGHSIWHLIWHIFWHSIGRSIRHTFWHSIWHYQAFYLAFWSESYLPCILTFYLAFILTFYLTYVLKFYLASILHSLWLVFGPKRAPLPPEAVLEFRSRRPARVEAWDYW